MNDLYHMIIPDDRKSNNTEDTKHHSQMHSVNIVAPVEFEHLQEMKAGSISGGGYT